MDPGETVVVASDNQEHPKEESKRSLYAEALHMHGVFNHRDDYSDIYFDKSCANMDELSIWNFSNLPKEIRLDEDNVSENWLFLRPSAHEIDFHKRYSNGAIHSQSGKDGDLDWDDNSDQNSNAENHPKMKYDMRAPSNMITTMNNSKEFNHHHFSCEVANSNGELTHRKSGSSQASNFKKNEGKLVFKITRINRATQKEKLITKNRRIISRCPHTSLKYYAKGMCK